ncbi:Myotubularin-like phosphatase domain, partial [Trinorchestia longiramus]
DSLPHPLYNGHQSDDDIDDSQHFEGKPPFSVSRSIDIATGEGCKIPVSIANGRHTSDSFSSDSTSIASRSFDVSEFEMHAAGYSSESSGPLSARSGELAFDVPDPGTRTPTSDIQSLYHLPDARKQTDIKKVLIVDARYYTNAVANRARGGGFEYPEYYSRSDIQFMNLDNIHTVRKMHQTLSQIVANVPDTASWLSAVEGSRWLCYLSQLLKSAVIVSNAIAVEGRPVVVHCSDGWDRTPQITALAQIMLDPYYRTLQGFEVLVEREWVEFGHKFTDRCGYSGGSNGNERCPVFLQWLDAVHQLLHQFPQAFQFNQAYLVKLSQHIYSNLFGTFLCNTSQERATCELQERTYPVWSIFNFNTHHYVNYFYSPTKQVLSPAYHTKDLRLWATVYRSSPLVHSDDLNSSASFANQPSTQDLCPEPNGEHDIGGPGDLVKTRSCDDLTQQPPLSLVRHSSDSNLKDSAPNLAMLNSAIGTEILHDDETEETIEMSSLDAELLKSSEGITGPNNLEANHFTADTNVDEKQQMVLMKMCNGEADDTLEKLIPVCRCIEKEERKRSLCDCADECNTSQCSVHMSFKNLMRLSKASGLSASPLPTEVRGIPEASKRRSEVASEISKGSIEKAIEADENGVVTSDEELEHNLAAITNEFSKLKIDARMHKSDSNVDDALNCVLPSQCPESGVIRGSTDTLICEGNICDSCNGVELSNCSLHLHGGGSSKVTPKRGSSSNAGCLDEEIVENLMRKKLQQQQQSNSACQYQSTACQHLPSGGQHAGFRREHYHHAHPSDDQYCGMNTASNCSVCMNSSRILADVELVMQSSGTGSLEMTRRNSSTDPCGSDGKFNGFNASSNAESSAINSNVDGSGCHSVPCGSVNGGSCGGSRVASSKSTPGHSRTPSSGCVSHGNSHHLPTLPGGEEERGVYSRSSSSSSSGGGGGWGGGVDGVAEVKDDVQALVHQLLARQEAEVNALRDHLAITQQALQQQLQHAAHCSAVRHCGIPTSCGTHDLDQSSHAESGDSSGSSYGGGGAESAGGMSDASWENLVPEDCAPSSTQGMAASESAGVPPGVTIMGRAPTLWVPDHTANNCHSCHAKFWVGLRKHHCR